MNDVKKDLIIDINNLHLECLKQPILGLKYGELYTEAKAVVEEIEESIKSKRSEIVEAVNANPTAFLEQGQKATVAVVEAFYRNHPDYIKLKSKLLQAKKEMEIADIHKWQISSRKDMLENLVKLHGQQYFSENVQVPEEFTKKVSDKKVASKLKNRRKRNEA